MLRRSIRVRRASELEVDTLAPTAAPPPINDVLSTTAIDTSASTEMPAEYSLVSTLHSLITPGDGSIPFRQHVRLTPFIRLKGFRWQRGTGLFDDEAYITVCLDLQATPFGGLQSIGYTAKGEDECPVAINELLRRCRDLRHCTDCCGLHTSKQLVNQRCAGCHIARNFIPEVQECSICQEPAHRYYVTKCGHAFHYGCLSQAIEDVQNSRQVLPPWIDPTVKLPLKCPNCRNSLDNEFVTYFTAATDD